MQLFFNLELDNDSKTITFSKEESKHLAKVLRKKENDLIYITNGNGLLFKANLIAVNIKQCTATIIETLKQPKPKYNLHLAVAPTKNIDRFEWFLEKATEIGINSITPIICSRSERKTIKPERLERIIQTAAKQSLQYYLPKLNPLISFETLINQQHKGDLFIAHCENTNKQPLKNVVNNTNNITVLIGPEGDFTKTEIDLAIKNKFIPVSLGQQRLRTETAAIIACHTVALTHQ